MLAENLQPSCSEIILPEACLTLPPACQEGVRDVLNRLQRMKEEGSWFKERTQEELNLLIPPTQKHAQDIFDRLRQYKNADNSWNAAWDAAGDAARNAAWDTTSNADRNAARATAWIVASDVVARGVAWGTAWNATLGATRGATLGATRGAAGNAARATAWEVVKDLRGFETNPFSSILSLYELGSAGIKFHQVEKTAGNEGQEEMLIVHFPLKLKDDSLVLACLAFPDGRTGDKTVQYIHSWQEDCSQIAPLHPLPQREIK